MQLLIPMIRVCPLCGKSYGEPPAISRTDNETPICPDCGTRQALSSIGVSEEEQQEIIETKGIIYTIPPAILCE